MAKKSSGSKKSSTDSLSASSKKNPKKEVKITPKKEVKTTPKKEVKTTPKKEVKKSTKKATKTRKTVSYKQEYIKLLEKTNKSLAKDIKAIRKAIQLPKAYPKDYEFFPKEEPSTTPSVASTKEKPAQKPKVGSIQEQILNQLAEITMQIKSRDVMFEELVNSPAKLNQEYFND